MMKTVYALMVGAMMSLGSMGALAQEPAAPVCKPEQTLALALENLGNSDLKFIVLTGPELDAFASGVADQTGAKPENIKTIIIPDMTVGVFAGIPAEMPVSLALYDFNDCFIAEIRWPAGLIRKGLGIAV